jgi:hypothetical protein
LCMKYVFLISICLLVAKSTSLRLFSFVLPCRLCLPIVDVRFPDQLLRLRFPSPTSRHGSGRLCMLALAVQMIPSHFFDCSYCYLVFPELINHYAMGFWSVQRSYIPGGQLYVHYPFAVGLHRADLSHFFFFFLVISVFSADRELANRTTP